MCTGVSLAENQSCERPATGSTNGLASDSFGNTYSHAEALAHWTRTHIATTEQIRRDIKLCLRCWGRISSDKRGSATPCPTALANSAQVEYPVDKLVLVRPTGGFYVTGAHQKQRLCHQLVRPSTFLPQSETDPMMTRLIFRSEMTFVPCTSIERSAIDATLVQGNTDSQLFVSRAGHRKWRELP